MTTMQLLVEEEMVERFTKSDLLRRGYKRDFVDTIYSGSGSEPLLGAEVHYHWLQDKEEYTEFVVPVYAIAEQYQISHSSVLNAKENGALIAVEGEFDGEAYMVVKTSHLSEFLASYELDALDRVVLDYTRGKVGEGILYAAIEPYVQKRAKIVASKFGSLGDRLKADIYQSCFLGALQAAKNYKGTSPFEGFAYWRTQGEAIDAMRSFDSLPREIREVVAIHQKVLGTFYTKYGRYPDSRRKLNEQSELEILLEKEGVEVTEETLDNVYFALDRRREVGIVPSDEEAEQSPGTVSLEALKSSLHDLLSGVDAEELLSRVNNDLDDMDFREATIFRMYFFENMTLANIGTYIGRTEALVSQIIGKIISEENRDEYFPSLRGIPLD